MRDTTAVQKSHVSRAEAAHRLNGVPLPLLRVMQQQVEEELQHEYRQLIAEEHVFDAVTRAIYVTEHLCNGHQRRAEEKAQRRERTTASLTRTRELLRAATQRQRAYEAAIAKTLQDLAHLRGTAETEQVQTVTAPVLCHAVDLHSADATPQQSPQAEHTVPVEEPLCDAATAKHASG